MASSINDKSAKKHKDDPQQLSELLTALRLGDHTAYEKIYLHYASSVKNFLRTLTRSHEVAKEITQEVFITLWEKRDKIDPCKNISGYLYTIAKNAALKHFRDNKLVKDEISAAVDPFENNSTPDEIIIGKEKEILIEIAISRMPPQRKKIYELSRIEGLSNAEIAKKLGISKNTVENHITSALKDLREVIAVFISLIFLQ